MLKIKTSIISFDGLNRSGKGTQIYMLAKYLYSLGQKVIVTKGEGSRKGDGSHGDTYSKFWQDLQPRLHIIDKNGDIERYAWELVSKQNSIELYDMYTSQIRSIEKGKCSILLDRSIISKYFFFKRYYPSINFEDLLEFEYSIGDKRKAVTPNLAFVLHVPKEILLERNCIPSEDSEKAEFRKIIIEKYYNQFETITWNLVPNFKMIHLDGNKPPTKIFDEILSVYRSMDSYL